MESDHLLSKSKEQKESGLTFDEALDLTVDRSRPCRGFLFQIIVLVVVTLAYTMTIFPPYIMSVLKGEPRSFRCRDESGLWYQCSKDEICEKGLSKDDYEADKEESSYIENWSDHAINLCETKARKSLLGIFFFLGGITASTIVPVGYLSDQIGRRWIFQGSFILVFLAALGFLLSTSIEGLYVSWFSLGLSLPGLSGVGVIYGQEF